MNIIAYGDHVDNVIVCDEADSERVLTSYYGIGVPSAAKRRLQQRLITYCNISSLVDNVQFSVHLARRLLLAERSNVSLKQELSEEKLHCEQLTEQVRARDKSIT